MTLWKQGASAVPVLFAPRYVARQQTGPVCATGSTNDLKPGRFSPETGRFSKKTGTCEEFNPHYGQAEGRPLVLRIWLSACWQVIQSYYGKHATPIKLAMQLGG